MNLSLIFKQSVERREHLFNSLKFHRLKDDFRYSDLGSLANNLVALVRSDGYDGANLFCLCLTVAKDLDECVDVVFVVV